MSQLKHRPEIDGLRALAVIPVLLFHANFPGFSGGFVGVDIFFVISGFLITGILLKENENQQYSITKFYERRARRLLPALFSVLAVTSVASYLLLPPSELLLYGKSLFASIAMMSNMYFYQTLNYFSVSAERLPLLHMWSLSVEEQFYILYPLILSACFAVAGRRLSFAVTLSLLAASYVGMLYVMGDNQLTLGFYFVGTRAWELLVGSVLAYYMHKLPTQGKVNDIASLTGLGMLLYAITQFEATAQYPNASALIPTIGTALILGFARPSTWVGGKLLVFSPFVFVGLISYSLYLWHQPVFAFLRALNGSHPTLLQFSLGIIGSAVLAYLTYRFVETPFRDREKWSQKRIFTFSLVGCTLLAATGLLFYVKKGLPERYDANVFVEVPKQGERICVVRDFSDVTPDDQRCHRNPDAPLTIALMGDSHGNELVEMLAEVMPNTGIQQVTHSGCPPIGEYYHWDASCREWYPKALDYLIDSEEIKTVIIHYRHTLHLYGEMGDNYPAPPQNKHFKNEAGDKLPNTNALYLAGLDALVNTLTDAGKKVVLTSPTPDLPDDINRMMMPKTVFSDKTKYSRTQTFPSSYYHDYVSVIVDYARTKQAHPLVSFADIGPTLCDTHCPAFYRDEPGYHDSNHVTLKYVAPLAERLKEHLMARSIH